MGSLTTCDNSFRGECCGNDPGVSLTGLSGRYTCDGNILSFVDTGNATFDQNTADDVACNPADFDPSLDADVFGTVISGVASMNAAAEYTYDPPFNCSCLYTADECTGTDIATCRSSDSCDML